MISAARAWIDWAEANGATLTPEQIGTIPAYQREIYAEELAEHERRNQALVAVPAQDAQAIHGLRLASKALCSLGWRLLEVAANEATGFVRVIAECRDWPKREGVQVMLLRSTHDSHVIEERSRVNLVDGMFKAEWEIGAHLGRRRFPTISEAARELLSYACGNGSAGALSLAGTEARQASIAAGLKALA